MTETQGNWLVSSRKEPEGTDAILPLRLPLERKPSLGGRNGQHAALIVTLSLARFTETTFSHDEGVTQEM